MSSAQMDFQNRLRCHSLRNPSPGTKAMSLRAIVAQKLVRKTDGSVPSVEAINKAAKSFTEEKKQRGRREGWRKTTKKEDRALLATFHKLRPKGHYVDSRMVHSALPRKLRTKVQRRTVRRRSADQGYAPTKKVNKTLVLPCASDVSSSQRRTRRRRLRSGRASSRRLGISRSSLGTPRSCAPNFGSFAPAGLT